MLKYLPEFARRLTRRVDFLVGAAIECIALVAVVVSGLEGVVVALMAVSVLGLLLLWGAFAVFQEERAMRAEREAKVRLIASPGSISWNIPDPGPGKVRLETHVHWEIWTDIDINTAQIGLNIVGVSRGRKWWEWWCIFRHREKRFVGLWPKGQDTFRYTKSFRSIDPQPIRDDAEFEYEGPLDWSDEDGILGLELVLVTGSPAGEHRAYVDPRLWERGSRKPL